MKNLHDKKKVGGKKKISPPAIIDPNYAANGQFVGGSGYTAGYAPPAAGVNVVDLDSETDSNHDTALTLACFQGRHEVVSLLLDRKANVEHRAKTGLTPLMEAASGGYTEVGRVLLDKGADVNAAPVPSSRDTALTIAADKGHYR